MVGQIFGCQIGVMLRDLRSSVVRSNAIFLNRDCGLHLQNVGAIVVEDNLLSYNGQFGLRVSGAGFEGGVVSVKRNWIQYNGMGIGFENGAKIFLESCTIAGNCLFSLSVVENFASIERDCCDHVEL